MLVTVQSVFPNYLIAEGRAGTSIKDHRPCQFGWIRDEKQLPAATCEGLGRAPHPLISLLPPPPTSLQRQTSPENNTLHCTLFSPHPTPLKPHGDPPTFWGCGEAGYQEAEKDAPLQQLSISLLEQLTRNTDSPPFSGHMIPGTSK